MLYDPSLAPREYPYGRGLKRELESVYDRPVNQGQLYPALSELVKHGLVYTRLDNQRANFYEFTERGWAALVGYACFLAAAADLQWPHHTSPLTDTVGLPPKRGDTDRDNAGRH